MTLPKRRMAPGVAIGPFLGLLLTVTAVAPALAVPQLPERFDGSVTVNGSPCPPGVTVSAEVPGVSRTFYVLTDQSGKYSSLHVGADDPETSVKEGAVNGDTVQLLVAGHNAGTAIFESGAYTVKDLSITIDALTVEASQAVNIATNSATLRGVLVYMGVASSVNVSFKYGSAPGGPYTGTLAAGTLTAPGNFEAVVTGLNSSTAYYFIAEADAGAQGKATSAEKSFMTLAAGTGGGGVTGGGGAPPPTTTASPTPTTAPPVTTTAPPTSPAASSTPTTSPSLSPTTPATTTTHPPASTTTPSTQLPTSSPSAAGGGINWAVVWGAIGLFVIFALLGITLARRRR